MDPILKVDNLTRIFTRKGLPDFTAVDHISFELYPGECLGLIGERGRGKTTVVNMITRLVDATEGSIVLSFAKFLMKVPGLPSFGVGLLKLLDRYGLMPKSLIDISPFHTSMFLTNVASLKMSDVFHHIYNFGTTSQFFSIGKREQHLQLDWQGNEQQRSYFPMGITLDERPCAGALLAQAMREFMRNLNHPELMLTPPKTVVTEGTNKN